MELGDRENHISEIVFEDRISHVPSAQDVQRSGVADIEGRADRLFETRSQTPLVASDDELARQELTKGLRKVTYRRPGNREDDLLGTGECFPVDGTDAEDPSATWASPWLNRDGLCRPPEAGLFQASRQ